MTEHADGRVVNAIAVEVGDWVLAIGGTPLPGGRVVTSVETLHDHRNLVDRVRIEFDGALSTVVPIETPVAIRRQYRGEHMDTSEDKGHDFARLCEMFPSTIWACSVIDRLVETGIFHEFEHEGESCYLLRPDGVSKLIDALARAARAEDEDRNARKERP
jgi:hypothetical protein